MNRTKSLISMLLAVLMLFTAAIPAFATEELSEEEILVDVDIAPLEEQWNDTEEATRGITMNPGKTESERNFSWYMDEGVTSCAVEISENEDMSDAKSFAGEIITTYQGDKSAKVTVTDLEENKTYYYTCVSGEEKSKVYSFTTEDATFSALYMSDIHICYSDEETDKLKNTSLAFAELLEKAKGKADINMILSGGDMATEGLRIEYEGLTFSDASRELTFATILGNHDRHSFDYKYFKNLPNELFGPMSGYQSGNYYFEKGGVLFLCVDTNNASATAHRDMIKEAVKAHPDAKWRVVMMHHDLYGGSLPHRETENNLLRILFSPIFDEFNIDLVLMGHSHHYSVSNVIYNGENVEAMENGKTVKNAKGTVYFTSTSVARPEEAEDETEVTYSDWVGIGMDELADSYYNIIDFSPEAITVTSYYLDTNEEYISFTLEKDDDYEPAKIGFFRKLGGILAAKLSTLYGIYVNADRYFELKEEGFEVGFFEFVF